MIHPRPTQPSYLSQASSARRWVRLVAERQGQPSAVVARRYRTMNGLAPECAAIVRAYCHQEAVRLVRAGEAAPEGSDLVDRTTRRYYERYTTIKDAQERAAQEATVQLILAMQHQAGE